jgi:hypothetical protein
MASLDALNLSDAQLTAVARASAALQPIDRDPFLRALKIRLEGEEIGDGSVFRAVRELFASGVYRTLMTVAIGGGPKGAALGQAPGRSRQRQGGRR